ncbi:uncharacterized protein BDR25DRAFT_361200 [Lindgomyces ingoldianus]|uniref:Uncharacterized protein n=1 Tax=Lindgomyces ingoldianus TaxID=673940 RepID=A0ACB6QEQ6_9PLEO|nr:uncharacterized protein BDR25DRAFT_361200 [Lindgomyces ingoldianus]KAF2464980.1 hypothetical protein BDR25DRAFT_361200 [Lindgomyces ingoldianus]
MEQVSSRSYWDLCKTSLSVNFKPRRTWLGKTWILAIRNQSGVTIPFLRESFTRDRKLQDIRNWMTYRMSSESSPSHMGVWAASAFSQPGLLNNSSFHRCSYLKIFYGEWIFGRFENIVDLKGLKMKVTCLERLPFEASKAVLAIDRSDSWIDPNPRYPESGLDPRINS